MTGQPVHQRHDIHMCKVDGAHCQPEEPCWLLGDQDSSTELQPVAYNDGGCSYWEKRLHGATCSLRGACYPSCDELHAYARLCESTHVSHRSIKYVGVTSSRNSSSYLFNCLFLLLCIRVMRDVLDVGAPSIENKSFAFEESGVPLLPEP
eukprot:scaffold150102_cov34-Tisochrysis_lutea.AAC.2